MNNSSKFKMAMRERGLGPATEIKPPSPKRLIAQQLERAIAQKGLTRAEVASRMTTSRAALGRLLDSDNQSVTLQTLEAAAAALDLQVIITLRPKKS